MRIKTLSALVALGLAGAALNAHAMDDRWYVAPTVSYVGSDSDRRGDDGWGAGVALGKAVSEAWNVEFGARYNTMDRDLAAGGGDYDQYSLGVDGLYFFNRNPGFAPYAVVGLGYLRNETVGYGDNNLMANAGLGFLRQISDDISLRADARYRWDSNQGNINSASGFGDWLVSVGLNIALGQKAQPAPKAAPAPEPAPVAAPAPAPAPAPAAAPAAEPMHALDKAKSGDIIVLLQGVNFEFDSAKLRPDAVKILDEAVAALKRRSDINVDVVGHTCNIGTNQYNQGLSERRAKTVYDYFVAKGIDAKRLASKGYGELKPAFSNATREGRAKNRRVELHVK